MATNQAAWLDEKATPFKVREAEMPKPGPDEVVIQNHAIAINPVDWKMQDTGFFIKKYPVILGCDVAGEIHEVGSNVTKFKKGDRVTGHCDGLVSGQALGNAFQLYSLVPAGTTASIPSSISYNEAVVLPLAIDTAAVGLYKESPYLGLPFPSTSPKSSGKTLVVWGGSSSVGALAIQLATASGVKVIAVASAKNHDLCKRCGASEAFDYNKSSVVDDVVSAVGKDSFAGIYDAISLEDSYSPVLQILEKLGGGHLAVTLPGPKDVPSNVTIGQVFGVDKVTYPIWEDFVTQALESGQLKCLPEPMVAGKGLEAIEKGVNENRKGVSAKKVVVEL